MRLYYRFCGQILRSFCPPHQPHREREDVAEAIHLLQKTLAVSTACPSRHHDLNQKYTVDKRPLATIQQRKPVQQFEDHHHF